MSWSRIGDQHACTLKRMVEEKKKNMAGIEERSEKIKSKRK